MVKVIDHPMVGNYLKILRHKETHIADFRSAMKKLGLFLAVEATKNLEAVPGTVITPLDVEAECSQVADGRVLLVPILRAGMGFVDSFLEILPSAKVGHIGLYRDHETLEARTYLDTLPTSVYDFESIYVLDPMLATGNSSVRALEIITAKGYPPERITLVCAFSVRQGLDHFSKSFPEINIITAVIDPGLNEKSYIVPGLGDAGDRLYLL
ncbi:MAG: uracil phosphoribosyltransferase [Desulfocucumaceae bacterium]